VQRSSHRWVLGPIECVSASPARPPYLKARRYATFSPHSAQNFALAASFDPQFVQWRCASIFSPQFGQNFTFSGSGEEHFGQPALTVCLKLSGATFALSSSDTSALFQIASRVLEACAADISTARSGEQCLQSPRVSFQQLSRQTQLEQCGHWANWGRISSTAFSNALSRSRLQDALRTRSLTFAAEPKRPPNTLLAVSRMPLTAPVIEFWKRVRNPLLHLSQKNSNWNPLSLLWSE
jgi:hypothetical protein